MTTKAITIRQPWAGAVVLGIKPTENRTWRTHYRGRILIHAGAQQATIFSRGPLASPSHQAVAALAGNEWTRPAGAIIGSVELVDCHPDGGCCRPWGESAFTDSDGARRQQVWHWVFEDARHFAPVPCRGRQGLWNVPNHILEAVGRSTVGA